MPATVLSLDELKPYPQIGKGQILLGLFFLLQTAEK